MLEAVGKYLNSKPSGKTPFSGNTPFFVFVGDQRYSAARNDLSVFLLYETRTSEFCKKADKLPDIDGLVNALKTGSGRSRFLFVTGLGEYLALRGSKESGKVLSLLKDLDLGIGKAVLLLRGQSAQLASLRSEPRFDGRRHCVLEPLDCDISLTQVSPAIGQAGLSGMEGFKAALEELEKGRSGNLVVNTAIPLDESMFTVRRIDTAYEGVRLALPGFALPETCGTEEQWAELLAELNENENSLDKVCANHELPNKPDREFHTRITGTDFDHWLYFIRLKNSSGNQTNSYLRFVLERAEHFEEFRRLVINAIIDVAPSDKRFADFYRERKELLERFPEPEIADFVTDNRKDVRTSVFRLTDNTRVEREEIVSWVARHGRFPELEKIYPALEEYLKKYQFVSTDLAELLTDYFEAYKRQKLANRLEPAFLEQVAELARSRPYNRLPSRNEILGKQDKTDTCLYWIDALGVEYLAFIAARIRKRGLALKVHVARAELPTITSVNRDFYDAWPGEKRSFKELDEVKHKEAGGYNFTKNDKPVHLAAELEIIAGILEHAATELRKKACKRILLASDHGASRLAVLHSQDKYEAENRGVHSGRCCPLGESPETLPCAVEANGFLTLADYGRFKGSRAANVEAHGGATLEEVVVPIIELSLKDDQVTAQLVETEVAVDFRSGAAVALFVNAPAHDVALLLRGKRYAAERTDANHYLVRLPDIKRAGTYTAEVYAGDNLLGDITFKAQGRTGKINDSFDDLF